MTRSRFFLVCSFLGALFVFRSCRAPAPTAPAAPPETTVAQNPEPEPEPTREANHDFGDALSSEPSADAAPVEEPTSAPPLSDDASPNDASAPADNAANAPSESVRGDNFDNAPASDAVEEPTPMPQMMAQATTEIRALAQQRPPKIAPVASGPNFGATRALATSPDFQPLPLKLPAPAKRPQLAPDPRISALREKNRKFPTFDAYRQLVALHLARGEYEDAIALYRLQAKLFRARGLLDAATLQEGYAARYETDARMFLERPANASDLARLNTDAVAEPPLGCYVGAFIDRDDGLGRGFFDEGWTTHRSPDAWARLTGKAHGSLWMYHAYGRPAPMTWLRLCKSRNIVPHLAWEPKSMAQVKDDAYLRDFLRDLDSLDWPVLIRFASEMNGKWTPYHRPSKLYRERFRLFYNVVRREAPKCAVVWCVSNPPLENIDEYYPGDDAVDWVGVNFYAVPFYDNNLNRPAFEDNPLALLDAVYRKYAKRKPIAVCEFAASHQAGVDMVRRPNFAQEKMSLIYGALPLLYPRVKLMDWFSMNTIRYATPGKTRSNYALTESQPTLQTYRALIANPWFLSRAQDESRTQTQVNVPLATNARLTGRVRLHLWARSYTPRPQVLLAANGRVLYAARRYGPHTLELDTAKLPAGATQLALLLYDDRNRFISAQRVNVTVSR